MKKLLFIGLYFLAFKTLNAQDTQLKIITYNIWNGFDWGKDTARRSNFQEWVRSQNPDIFAMQELCAYTPEKLSAEAKTWGHSYSVLLKTTGYSVGITSRFPIDLKDKILRGLHHGALYVKIKNIDFIVVHLHPGSIEFRRNECKILLPKLDSIRKESSNYIVLGDFNAHSPFDGDLYRTESQLINQLNKTPNNTNLEDGNLDYAVMSSFLSFPLIDIVQKFTQGMSQRGSFPSHALATEGVTTKDLDAQLERIDYMMVSPNFAKNCLHAEVLNKGATYLLSDHYPVMAIFKMPN